MRRSRALNLVTAAAVVAVVVAGYLSTGPSTSSASASETLTTAKTGIVLSSVSASGNLETPDALGLSFQQSGLVVAVSVTAGQQVSAGAELARLDDTTQRNALAAAEASVASAEAQLAARRRGQTSTERAQNDAGLSQSAVAVDNAEAALDRARASAAQNALKYQLQVDQAREQLASAQAGEDRAEADLGVYRSSLAGLQSAYDPSAGTGATTAQVLSRYKLDQSECQAHQGDPAPTLADGVACSQVANLVSAAQSVGSAETGLTQAQASTAAVRRSVDTASQNQASGLQADAQQVQSAQGSLRSAQASYASTEAANAVKGAPAKPEELAQAEASVASARNQVATATKNLDETVLRAPVDGTVASVDGQVGDHVGSGGTNSGSSASSGSASSGSTATSGFVVLSDPGTLEVKVGFTETDAAKVRVGQRAAVTVEAAGARDVPATVASLDLNQTVVNNVVTYYARVGLDDVPASAKPGMTASVSVTLDKREGVVTLASAAVPSQGTTANVTVRDAQGTDVARTIGIGLRGDSAVEITSGLAAGEQVVTRAAAGAAPGGFRPPGAGGLGGGLGGGGPR